MLYELINFLIRPLRRWWRRAVIAAVIATVIMPVGRQMIEDATTEQRTIPAPPVP